MSNVFLAVELESVAIFGVSSSHVAEIKSQQSTALSGVEHPESKICVF